MARIGRLRRSAVADSLRNILFSEPIPARFHVLRALNRRFGLVKSYRRMLDYGMIERAYYGHCMLHAAMLARKLGHRRISSIEFGVAGGNGLVAMERHAEAVQAETGVEVAVYGFDTGTGMPPPQDYRDMPYMWQPGYFAMDVPKLRARLKSAKLILGDVAETLREFADKEKPPPIGFIAFDLDYYSSTVAALTILEAVISISCRGSPATSTTWSVTSMGVQRVHRRAAGHQGLQRGARTHQDRAGERSAVLGRAHTSVLA